MTGLGLEELGLQSMSLYRPNRPRFSRTEGTGLEVIVVAIVRTASAIADSVFLKSIAERRGCLGIGIRDGKEERGREVKGRRGEDVKKP